MSKNEKVTENKEQTEQKVMTKYDRKVQKRKEEKEKEKKEERISTAIGIVVLVALVCLGEHLSPSVPIWQLMRPMWWSMEKL